MAPNKRRRITCDDEAECDDAVSSDDYDSANDTAGSLDDFIVDHGDGTDDSDIELDDSDCEGNLDTPLHTAVSTRNQGRKRKSPAASTSANTGIPTVSPPTETATGTGGTRKITAAALRRQQAAAAKAAGKVFKPPGDSSYPANDFSLTVTKTKDDVGLDSLDSIAKFIEDHCLKGGVSTEVGQRVFQLHLQGVFRLQWPTTKEYIQRLQKILKLLLPLNGVLYKVLVKGFKPAQTFSAMIGYITKDQGQAHYQVRTHNISRQELSFGRRDHDALLTSFDDSKKVLNLKNFFNECYKFNMRCMHPAVIPIQYTALYMIQSGTYILSPDFISTYKKIDLSEARVLWNMVHAPSEVSMDDIMQLLFDPRSYGPNLSKRYHIAGTHRLDREEASRIIAPAAATIPPTTGVNRMIQTIRASRGASSSASAAPATTTSGVALQPDFLGLDGYDSTADQEEDMGYTISRRPISAAGTMHALDSTTVPTRATFDCPDHLDEMMLLVRQLRATRLNSLVNSGAGESVTTGPPPEEYEHDDVQSQEYSYTSSPPPSSSSSSAAAPRVYPKNRGGNGTVRNALDIESMF